MFLLKTLSFGDAFECRKKRLQKQKQKYWKLKRK